MNPTMPADRKQVEGAVERLRARFLSRSYQANEHDYGRLWADCFLLLTDHAALLARAEAAEVGWKAALKDIDALHKEVIALRADADRERARAVAAEAVLKPFARIGDLIKSYSDAKKGEVQLKGLGPACVAASDILHAAHQQPAPVKAGET